MPISGSIIVKSKKFQLAIIKEKKWRNKRKKCHQSIKPEMEQSNQQEQPGVL